MPWTHWAGNPFLTYFSSNICPSFRSMGTHTHTHTHTYTHKHTHTHIHICMYTHTHTHTHTRARTLTHTCSPDLFLPVFLFYVICKMALLFRLKYGPDVTCVLRGLC